jgi:hypothetical protein
MDNRLEMSPERMIEALKHEVWLRDTEIERLRDERIQIAHKIIEDEARLSKARRYVVRVDNKDVA